MFTGGFGALRRFFRSEGGVFLAGIAIVAVLVLRSLNAATVANIAYLIHTLLVIARIPHSAYTINGVPVIETHFPDRALPFIAIVGIQCSGAISTAVFSIIMLATVFPHRDIPRRIKLLGLLAGAVISLVWNTLRVALAIAVGYYFGTLAFQAVHYGLGPAIDFLWIVAIWAATLAQRSR
mgnify:CR=1 FL=1